MTTDLHFVEEERAQKVFDGGEGRGGGGATGGCRGRSGPTGRRAWGGGGRRRGGVKKRGRGEEEGESEAGRQGLVHQGGRECEEAEA